MAFPQTATMPPAGFPQAPLGKPGLGPQPGFARAPQQANAPAMIGSFILGVYLALHACAAPEFMMAYFGISVKFIAPLAVLVLILGLSAGGTGRFFSAPVALPYTVLFVLWMLSTMLLSLKNEWTNMFQYGIRYHLLPVLMCSIMSTSAALRRTLTIYTLGFVVTILFCFLYGSIDEAGRFQISMTSFQNPNDLAFNLLFGVSHLTFFVRRKGLLARLLAGVATLAAIYFVLKTGSRANLVVLFALLGTLFFISNNATRAALVSLSVVGAIAAMFILPRETLLRLTSFTSASQEDLNRDEHLRGAIGSTEARKELQRRAILITLQNPILGVGPGMYMYALSDFMVKQESMNKGSWQRAHNTYLELSAETGIPAFLIYTGCLIWCVSANLKSLKMLKLTRQDEDSQAVSLALLMTSITFMVGTAFCSIPYQGGFPALLGFTAANFLIVRENYFKLQGSQRGAMAGPAFMPAVNSSRGLAPSASFGRNAITNR
jgi:O-antigen ligase